MQSVEPGGEGLLVVGRIIRPHGIRGAVIVEVESDWPDRFREGAVFLVEAEPGRFDTVEVESCLPHKGKMLIFLRGVTDRNKASGLNGSLLFVSSSEAAPLSEGEYWLHDLLGMIMVAEDGRVLGEVADVICREAQDLLVIDRAGVEFQVPFVDEFVRSVDAKRRVITVRIIEGMEP